MQQTHSEEDSQKSKGDSGGWSPRYLFFCLFCERRTCVWCFQRSSMNSGAPFPNHPLSLDCFFFFKVVCLLTCVQCLPTRLYSIIFSVQPPASFRCCKIMCFLWAAFVWSVCVCTFSFRSNYFPFTTTLKFCSAEPSGSQEYRDAEDLLHIFSFENMQCSISEKSL